MSKAELKPGSKVKTLRAYKDRKGQVILPQNTEVKVLSVEFSPIIKIEVLTTPRRITHIPLSFLIEPNL